MPKEKLFRDLSKSQKNRRLRKVLIKNNIISIEISQNEKQDGVQQNFRDSNDDYVGEDFQNSQEERAEDFRAIYAQNHATGDSRNNDDNDENTNMNSESSDVDTHTNSEDSDINNENVDESSDDGHQLLNFNEMVAHWICHYNISHEAARALLHMMKNSDLSKINELPSDPRTLLGTPESTITRSVPPGNYFHYGLKNALIDQFQHLDITKMTSNIEINIHIDGLPLAKSSSSQFYPILGQIFPLVDEPFVIGAYHGHEKPYSSNVFLEQFINEYTHLQRHGFEYLKKIFKVSLRAVICDSPARSYVACTKQFNAYFGCGKCREEGDYIDNRVLLLNLNAELRTDENFLYRVDEEHHTGISIFEEAGVGMVSQFPLDYMHLVCLGVTKKILLTFIKGPHKFKFSSMMCNEISTRLKTISKWVPSEFVRKCRTFSYVDRWKATEFRLFLLYVGPVALQGYLPKEYMEHFISLHCAVRILCHEEDCTYNFNYAKYLLVYFVENCTPLYGQHYIIYNIHNLIHLANEVLLYGHLDSFSAFPFESFLNTLKKYLRKGDKPLQQLHRRIVERATCHIKHKNVYSKEPKLKGVNKKATEEFGIVSYDIICYKNFKLSLRGQRDRFCYVEDNNVNIIVRIKNIAINRRNEPIIIGQSLMDSIGFPDYPIDSKEFDIAVGNKWSETTTFKAKDLKIKAICIPYRKSFCFLPLLHTSIENDLSVE